MSLPDYCAPRKLFIVESIPRSALGKVLSAEISKISLPSPIENS
jgi:acyl-coenzyme A synthetase/AMP-(fatty) acid ligase